MQAMCTYASCYRNPPSSYHAATNGKPSALVILHFSISALDQGGVNGVPWSIGMNALLKSTIITEVLVCGWAWDSVRNFWMCPVCCRYMLRVGLAVSVI